MGWLTLLDREWRRELQFTKAGFEFWMLSSNDSRCGRNVPTSDSARSVNLTCVFEMMSSNEELIQWGDAHADSWNNTCSDINPEAEPEWWNRFVIADQIWIFHMNSWMKTFDGWAGSLYGYDRWWLLGLNTLMKGMASISSLKLPEKITCLPVLMAVLQLWVNPWATLT